MHRTQSTRLQFPSGVGSCGGWYHLLWLDWHWSTSASAVKVLSCLFLFIHKLSGLRLTITNIFQYWGTWMAPDYFTIAFWGKQCFWGNSAEFDFLQTLTSITWKYPNSSSQGPFSILDKTSNWRQLCWWKFEKIIQHFQNTHCHIAKFELHSKTK